MSSPDARIVGIIDQAIACKPSDDGYEGTLEDAFSLVHEDGSIEELTKDEREYCRLRILIKKMKAVTDDESHEGVKMMLKNMEQQAEEKRREVCRMKPEECLEVLQEGRIQLTLVLNSPGGQMNIAEDIEELALDIKERGGSVDVFGGTEVMSAAAKLFETGTTRLGLEDSLYLWHVRRADPNQDDYDLELDDEDVDLETIEGIIEADNQNEDVENIIDFFSRSTTQSSSARVSALLDAAKAHKDFELIVSGKDLQEFGIIDQNHTSVEDLADEFLRRTGILIDTLPHNHKIERVFRFLQIEHEILQQTGVRVRVFSDLKGRTRLMPIQDTTQEQQDAVRSAYRRWMSFL